MSIESMIEYENVTEICRFELHRAEIRRQFWVLVRNCPWKVIKFIRQRRELMRETYRLLNEGFYLTRDAD